VKMGEPNDVANMYFDILFGDGGKPKLIDIPPENNPKVASPSVLDSNGAKCELDVFLEGIPEDDHCVSRRNYNKNENRMGDKRAEILDYILVRDNDFNPVEIKTEDTIKIYIKTVFNQPFQLPVYGFTIKTIDGVKVCGTNTWLDQIDIAPIFAGTIVIFRYDIEMNLCGGDFFITLAISNRVNNQYILSDHRTDLILIHVQQEKEGFNGLVEMKTKSQIISQTAIAGNRSPA